MVKYPIKEFNTKQPGKATLKVLICKLIDNTSIRCFFFFIAAERASLKRASEAADLICVCRGEFISNHVYCSALWSCAFGNAQNTFTHLCFVTNYVLCSEDIMFQTGYLKNRS